MQAAIEQGVSNFDYGGSLLIYGNTDEPIDQVTEPSPISGCGRAKLEAEMRLAEMAANADICFRSLKAHQYIGINALSKEENQLMNVWIPILLLLILAEVWWFGAHCTAYLSDIRDLLEKAAKADKETVNQTSA